MSGSVGILNVGAGDTKLTFDKNNPAECIRAARIVTDMLRRGYALLAEVGKKKGQPVYQRVMEFKADTFEYIIADLDPVQAAAADKAENEHGESGEVKTQHPESATGAPTKRGRGRPKLVKRSIPATGTNAVAVARTAGG
jgi:hypothetical protein